MAGRMDGWVALVTGGAQGMGAAIAARLADDGATVFVADLPDSEVGATAERLGGTALSLDVTDEPGWADAIATVLDHAGRLDVLVNNAGVAGGTGAITSTALPDWNRVLAVNCTGVFLGIKHSAELMTATAQGLRNAGATSIVNVSSAQAVMPSPFSAAYAASKWAVRGLTRTAALELAHTYASTR